MHLPVTAHDIATALLTDDEPGSFLVVLAELASEDEARGGALCREIAQRHNLTVAHDRVERFLGRIQAELVALRIRAQGKRGRT